MIDNLKRRGICGTQLKVSVLADDHSMVRKSLARVLDACGEIEVVGQAGDGVELRQVVKATRPECLVMDYSMPNHEPTEVIDALLRKHQDPKNLVLTVHENVHYAVRTLEAGAANRHFSQQDKGQTRESLVSRRN